MRIISFIIFFFFIFAFPVFAQYPQFSSTFLKGEVIKILESKTIYIGDSTAYEEDVQIKILEGNDKNKIILVKQTGNPNIKTVELKVGMQIVLSRNEGPNKNISYAIYEPYRLDNFLPIFLIFVFLVLIIGGRRGLSALLGLIISIFIINQWMVPQIIQGRDALFVIIISAIFILITTTYIAHGFSYKTTVAVISTAISLLFTFLVSTILANSLDLMGMGNEAIYQLQLSMTQHINTRGLLLGGILIGTLGALNDITTTQSITMFTLVKDNPGKKLNKLFIEGMNIGKEHIASLINTLVLAYAGSSLAIFIFFNLNPLHLPLWVILNNENTMEEIITAIVGSSALMISVPLTTILAIIIAKKKIKHINKHTS